MSDSGAIRRRGDRQAASARLDRLYRAYSPWLTARLRRRFGADAEDIVQDAWVRLAPIAPGLDIRNPKAFLLTVATNLGASRVARDQRRSALRDAAFGHAPAMESGDQHARVELEDLVLALPGPLRDVFVLSRFRGLSTIQIAETLGIRPKTVEWRMTKALAQIAAQLQR